MYVRRLKHELNGHEAAKVIFLSRLINRAKLRLKEVDLLNEMISFCEPAADPGK